MTEQDQQQKFKTERKYSFGFWFGVGTILIAIEQLTKFLAQHYSQPIFFNNNFAFSLPVPVVLMYIIYAAVLVAVLRIILKDWNRFTSIVKLGWTLVLAGGLSNIVERIILGHVRDFIYIANGVFNLADFFIIIGLLIIVSTYQRNFTKS